MDMLLLVDNYYIGVSGSCSGIYCFENLIDGKPYVGQGQILKRRKVDHFRYLRNNNDSEYFQIAWNEVGKENFKFFVLEECPTELLNEREVFWIAELHSYFTEWGYNKTRGGQCVRGFKHSKETIQKMKENRPDQFGENNPSWGKHPSPETIEKMRKSREGKIRTEESILKTSGKNNGMFGKKLSPETIQKMIDNNWMRGKHHSPETIQKIKDNLPDMSGENNSFYGKKHTEESIQKIKESHSGINNYRTIKKEVVQHIKDMLDNKISQTQIAKLLGISHPTIYKVKNGWYKDIYGIDGINKKEDS